MITTLASRVATITKKNSLAMLCTASNRLPCCVSAASMQRAAAASPLRAPLFPARTFLVRAQNESTSHKGAESKLQQQQSESAAGGSQLQQRNSQGSDLSTMPFANDLMDLRKMMPMPFRRMADHMLQMQREMDSMMGAFMPSSLMATDPWDIFDRAVAPMVARRAGVLGRVVPLEVTEDDNSYTVTAEVPGFEKKDLKISLSEDGVLNLTGSHEEVKEGASQPGADKEGGDAAKGVTARVSSKLNFMRSVQLPDDADTGGITATTQHGMLTVHIPKTAKPAPKVREIPVA